jgi:hypothetical protein
VTVAAAMAFALAAPMVAAAPATAADGGQVRPAAAEQHAPEETKALARAAETGKPVEVLSQRTETSQVFANPSGSFTQDTYAVAQWVRKDNKLVDIDPTLKKAADGHLVTRATQVGLKFSGGGKGPLVTIARDGRSMSWSWPKPLPAPQVDENTVTYPEVFPGVDLKLRAGAVGFSQMLVVKSAQAAANPALKSVAFGLGTKGLKVSADAHGNLRAVNPAGQELFTAPTPRMWDSSVATTGPAVEAAPSMGGSAAGGLPTDEFEPGHGARQSAMPLTVASDKLVVTPDSTLLTGKDTTYPVYIDPSVSGAREAWTIAYMRYPDATFYNGAGWVNPDGSKGTTLARIGYENHTNGTARSFFRMDSNNLWSTDKRIIASTFRIKNSWSWSCTDRTAEVWLTGSISTTTSWSRQPSWSRKLDSVNDSKGYSSTCPAGNLAFDVTSAAKESVTKKWNNITLGLRATSETDVYAWKKFDAGSAVLSTSYNTAPAAPYSLDTIPSTRNSTGCGDKAPYGLIGNTDIYLTAKAKDADGGTVNVKFHLWATGHHPSSDPNGVMIVNQTTSVTSGGTAKVKVPKATLLPHLSTANGNFSWKAQTNDGSLYSEWTPTQGAPGCRFVYDPNRPSNPPDVTSSQFPDGSNGWPVFTGTVRTEGTFTFSSGGVSDVTKYEYWTSWDTTRRTATPGTAGGSVAVKLTPPVVGSNQVYVRSFDNAANPSDTANYLFYAKGPASVDKPGDINGDGNADLWGIDQGGTLHRFYGAGDGTLTEASSTASSYNWDGDQITHRGDWTGDPYEDLVALRHDPDLNTKRLWVHPNSGWGFACTSCTDFPGKQELSVYDPANNHWKDGAKQILAVGDVDGGLDTDGDGVEDIPGYPDLLVNDGTFIWLYYGNSDYRLDSYAEPVLLAGPDDPIASGISQVGEVTLAAPGDWNGDGRVDLVVRYDRPDVGGLYVFHGGTNENDGEYDISLDARTGIGSNWSTSTVPMFVAAPDGNNNGVMDLWATTPDTGRIRFFADYTASGHTAVTIATEALSGYQRIA